MDPRIYKLHIENEKEHWWYKGRREIISSIISKFIFKNNKLKILDFGAGSGANTIALSHYGEVYVYEKNENSLQLLKKRFEKISNIFVIDEINENIFFDLVVASDVIEHIENDDEIIKFFSKVLKNDGNILITVPAYNFLYTERDKVLGHFRRYNSKTLKKKTDKYFKIIKLSYYNFFLFFLSLVLFVFLKLFKIKSLITSPENTPNSFLNNLFYKIFSSEKFFLKYLNFPFGSSIVYLAKKINK
jgi:2-polyprenyl-3-methyl-5-hydroxy-6-metoxy-1,4-benzoquinol methylase